MNTSNGLEVDPVLARLKEAEAQRVRRAEALQEERRRLEEVASSAGREAGRRWVSDLATDSATPEQLRRLCRCHRPSKNKFMPPPMPLPLPRLLGDIVGDRWVLEMRRVTAQKWNESAFAIGFADGALEVWDRYADQLPG